MNHDEKVNLKESSYMYDTAQEDHIFHFSKLTNETLDWIEKNSDDIFGIWNSCGSMINATGNTFDVLGYRLEDLLGDQWKKIIHPDELKCIEDRVRDRNEELEFHVRVLNQNDDLVFLKCYLKKIYNNESNNYNYLCLFRDISHKMEMNDLIVHSEKMSVAGQLAAGIAHEIRNPLTSLKGFLQLIQAGIKEKGQYYQIMIEEIDKIESITSELLFISKPLTNLKQKESVTSMLKDIMLLLNTQANIRNIEIFISETEDYYIVCNRSQIKQALLNIVKNAIEATPDGGKVTIEFKCVKGFLRLDIVDEGPGVSEDILHKVKEPFFTTKKSGTGLGLMITKQIVEQHQGELIIIKNDNIGSTFRLHLPMKLRTDE